MPKLGQIEYVSVAMVQRVLSDEATDLVRQPSRVVAYGGGIMALFGVPVALSAADAAISLASLYPRHPELYPLVWGETLVLLIRLVWYPLLVHALCTALAMSGVRPRLVVAAQAVLGLSVALYLAKLSQLRMPHGTAVLALGPVFVLTPLLSKFIEARRWSRLMAQGTAYVVALGGALALTWSYMRYERYLNVSATVLVSVIAIWLLHCAAILVRKTPVRTPALLAVGAVAALLLLVGAAVKPADAASGVARSYTSIGRAATRLDERHALSHVPAAPEERKELASAHSALTEFMQRAELPPAGAVSSAPLNVLLITSEATRFDRTSLVGGAGHTPSLAAFAKSGAYSFNRAQSPSHVTLQSVSALHTLSFPFAVPLDVWDVLWNGELRPEATTIAEVLSAAGYATWMATHSDRRIRCCILLGIDQGFHEKRHVERNPKHEVAEIDREVADHAIANIQRLASAGKPFFGWAFLGAPHLEYEVRYPDMPAGNPAESYLHEIRYMDEQLGRILAALRHAGAEDRTIVIYTGDHGEELLERGGAGHLTLHEESVHVPLLIRIPGLSGADVSVPMSALNGVAWALLHASPAARAFAEQRIEQHLLPVLRAAGVPSAYTEALSPEGSNISLATNTGQRTICNLARNWCELYDLRSDPGARVDLKRQDPFLLLPSSIDGALRALLALRKDQSRYRLVDRFEPTRRLAHF